MFVRGGLSLISLLGSHCIGFPDNPTSDTNFSSQWSTQLTHLEQCCLKIYTLPNMEVTMSCVSWATSRKHQPQCNTLIIMYMLYYIYNRWGDGEGVWIKMPGKHCYSLSLWHNCQHCHMCRVAGVCSWLDGLEFFASLILNSTKELAQASREYQPWPDMEIVLLRPFLRSLAHSFSLQAHPHSGMCCPSEH